MAANILLIQFYLFSEWDIASATYLPDSGYAGNCVQSFTVFKRVFINFSRQGWSWTNKTHISFQNINKLGKLINAVHEAVTEYTGVAPELSTGGGTSDGRFISPAGTDVVELGPVNASIHKIDEHVKVADVVTLTNMYKRIMELMLL